jgi:uncharacterized membrane protein
MEFVNELFGSSLLFCSLLFFGLVVFLFWPVSKGKGESAWEVLHKKFAEGALSVEQYQERKVLLEHKKRS